MSEEINPIKKPSKFSEYFNLYAHGLTQADVVIAARWNKAVDAVGLLDDDVKTEAERRLAICETCPFNSVNAQHSQEFTEFYRAAMRKRGTPMEYPLVPKYQTNRADSDLHCSWCGCDIDSKVLGMEGNCGIENYNAVYGMNEPLKWTKYTKDATTT